MKKNVCMFLSAAAILTVLATACSTGNNSSSYSDYPNPELRKAIEADIEARLASYVLPYDEVKPVYSSDEAKKIFLAIPELNTLAKEPADFDVTFADAEKATTLKLSSKAGVVQVEANGFVEDEAVLSAALTEALTLFYKAPFTSVSQVNLITLKMLI